jgi:uncharacterized SAM-dependent methyltransferase
VSQTITHSAKDARHTALLAELRDSLARLQPEIPSKHLSDPAVQELRTRVGEVFAHHQATERSLMATILPTFAGGGVSQPSDGRRVFFCLANAIGRNTTVGSIRLLRELRAGMRAYDRLVIGVDLRDSLPVLERLLNDPAGMNAGLHRGVLTMLNGRFDADFDEGRFEYRVVHRPELHRLETHLVARQAHTVTIGADVAVSLKKRDSILMSVRCTFTRSSLEGLLNGVGLELDQWVEDDLGRYAVGVAVPMHRET